MTIYEALNAVKRDLGAISKGDTMKAGTFSYKYRSIDDVLNALHPVLVQHGVIGPVPNVIERTQSGKKTIITSGFTFFHTDGSSVTGATVGEGDDPGDKGANKASTGALKTFLTQTLAIPFDTDDPDHYPSQPASSDKGLTESKPAAKVTPSAAKPPASAPKAKAAEKTCPECTFVIGAADSIKRKAGKTYHKACLEGKPDSVVAPASAAADDIESILDSYGK